MKLNVDFIKIDGSFIKNIDTDIPSQVLTELIVLFAKKQNIKTIAEFVHSPDILGKVKSLDIDFSQGYFLGEPQECI
jgi:EAL domain-containing protein (putative c-di-GMP-specific phosphodiesterase class I)